MAAVSEVSPYIDQLIRRQVGISSSDITDLSSAELDTIVDLMKLSGTAKYRVGGYYGTTGPISTLLMVVNELVVCPFIVHRFMVVEEIGLDVTTAGTNGGDVYTAVYKDTGSAFPGGLLHASAALASTAGFKSTASLDIELVPGLYWVGAVNNNQGGSPTSPTVRAVATSYAHVGLVAGADDTDSCSYVNGSVTGAPSATFSTTFTVQGKAPRVLFKVKQA